MANASPCMSSGAMTQVFFPPGGSSPPVSSVMQQGTPIPVAPMPVQGTFPAMDLSSGQGPGGVLMPTLPPTPAGVSFIIQIGLTRESVLMPLTADLAYVKQIACSIVDTKVESACGSGCQRKRARNRLFTGEWKRFSLRNRKSGPSSCGNQTHETHIFWL